MQKRKIVGFGYKAQSGKDTASKLLVRNYGFIRTSFGDGLKQIASQLTGIPLIEFYKNKNGFNKTWGMTHRQILQYLGTNSVRNHFHEDAWVLKCFNDMEEDENYTVSDVRFPNECERIKQEGGVLILINRDTTGYEIERDHESETSLDDYDGWNYVINNDGTIYDLYSKVIQCMYLEDIHPMNQYQLLKKRIKHKLRTWR